MGRRPVEREFPGRGLMSLQSVAGPPNTLSQKSCHVIMEQMKKKGARTLWNWSLSQGGGASFSSCAQL